MSAMVANEQKPAATPGTLIVRYGDEVVTLDPTAPLERFYADRERTNILLMMIDRDFVKGRRHAR